MCAEWIMRLLSSRDESMCTAWRTLFATWFCCLQSILARTSECVAERFEGMLDGGGNRQWILFDWCNRADNMAWNIIHIITNKMIKFFILYLWFLSTQETHTLMLSSLGACSFSLIHPKIIFRLLLTLLHTVFRECITHYNIHTCVAI